MMIEVPNLRGWLRIKKPGEPWTSWVGNAFTPLMKESLCRHWTDLTSGSLPYKMGKAGGSNPTSLNVTDASSQLSSMPQTVDSGYPVYMDYSMRWVWTIGAGVGTGEWVNVYVCSGTAGIIRMSAFENQTAWGTKGGSDVWVVDYKVEVI